MRAHWIALVATILTWGCGDRIDFAPTTSLTDQGPKRESSGVAPHECPEVGDADPETLRAMLDEGRFAELEAALDAYPVAYRSNVLCEHRLYVAWDVLVDPDAARLAALERWVHARPRSAAAHAVLGYAETGAGYRARGTEFSRDTPKENFQRMRALHASAAQHLDIAMQLDPGNPYPVARMAKVLRATGNCEAAIAVLDRYLQIDPLTYEARRHVIDACDPKWGGSIEAIAALADRAQAHVGKNPRLPALLGFPYHYLARNPATKDHSKKIELWTRALEHGDHFGSYSTGRAEAYFWQRDYQAAFADANRAVRYAPDFARAHLWRGAALFGLGRTEDALGDFDVAIDLDPDEAEQYAWRASANRKIHRFEAAADDYRSAIEANPKWAWAHEQLAFTLLEPLGRPEEAEPAYRRALELDPDEADSWYYLGLSIEQQGRAQGVVDAYRRYLELAADARDPDSEHVAHATAYLEGGASAEPAAPGPMPGLSTLGEAS